MRYEIKYTRKDMPEDYIGCTVKYARDEDEALKFFCGKKPDKQGHFLNKRGGRGKILSITKLQDE